MFRSAKRVQGLTLRFPCLSETVLSTVTALNQRLFEWGTQDCRMVWGNCGVFSRKTLLCLSQTVQHSLCEKDWSQWRPQKLWGNKSSSFCLPLEPSARWILSCFSQVLLQMSFIKQTQVNLLSRIFYSKHAAPHFKENAINFAFLNFRRWNSSQFVKLMIYSFAKHQHAFGQNLQGHECHVGSGYHMIYITHHVKNERM